MAAPAPATVPTRLVSRPYIRKLGSKALVTGGAFGGANVSFEMKKTAYLGGALVRVFGTYTVAVAALVFQALAPYNLLRRITFNPPGLTQLIDVNGWNLHMENLFSHDFAPARKGFLFDAAGLDANAAGANNRRDTFPTALGAQTFELWFYVPFARTAIDPLGVLPLFHDQTMELVFSPPAAAGDLVTVGANLTAFAATVDVWEVKWTRPPADTTVIQFADPRRGHAILLPIEDQEQAVAATGDNEVIVTKGGKLVRIIHTFVNNAARNSADIESLTFELDDSKELDTLERLAWDFYTQKRLGGTPPPVGVVLYDRDPYADSDGSAGDALGEHFQISRGQWLQTQDINTTKSTIRIAAATVLTNARIYTSVRRARVIGG